MLTKNIGIDYGRGMVNIDTDSGIRYGVIHVHDVDYWCHEAEPVYGEPHCPECGAELGHNFDDGDMCAECQYTVSSVGDECYPDSPAFWVFELEGFKAEQNNEDPDIFVTKSPYYTTAQFCSPCAPGACYLVNTVEDGPKAYCFGHDMFESGVAPYPVYRVATGELVKP